MKSRFTLLAVAVVLTIAATAVAEFAVLRGDRIR